jgi:DNA repair exonuclease SbcCD nuclease subunit
MENIKEERSLRSVGRPKGKPTHLVKVPEDMWAEVEDYRKKKQLDTWPEAVPLYYSTKDSYKAPLVIRTEKIEQRIRKECNGRVKDAVASFVKQVTELQNDIEALKSQNGKLKWQLNANVANVDKISRLEAQIIEKDSENTQKDSEIAKLKAEIEKGPSPEIMKEYSEMKERIQSLESNLNEARKGKTESPSFYDDDWLPEYWPFANMEEYKTWFESE